MLENVCGDGARNQCFVVLGEASESFDVPSAATYSVIFCCQCSLPGGSTGFCRKRERLQWYHSCTSHLVLVSVVRYSMYALILTFMYVAYIILDNHVNVL